MANQSTLYIGPAGWSYPDWRGVVYPSRRPSGFSELEYLSRYFNMIELNVTFYRIPPIEYVRKWSSKVKEHDFQFCVKLGKQYTHSSNMPDKQDTQAFKTSIRPLVEQDQIGALLLQFPWRFKYSKANLDHLIKLLNRFSEYQPAVEFRHKSWQCEPVFQTLQEHNAAFVNIDQPVIGKSIEPSANVTAPVGYCRLHGRNYKTWFEQGAGRDARYDYLYDDRTLNQWAKLVKLVRDSSTKTFVVFNNHFRGQAVVNALQMKAILEERNISVPPDLKRTFPELLSISQPEPGETLSLF
ncbi:MAG: DUF72 domain-containing protein [candidate division KSB1 bacterium]|nr:DUF72 domain-containing protein [candidate division KSB1 bacterium]